MPNIKKNNGRFREKRSQLRIKRMKGIYLSLYIYISLGYIFGVLIYLLFFESAVYVCKGFSSTHMLYQHFFLVLKTRLPQYYSAEGPRP